MNKHIYTLVARTCGNPDKGESPKAELWHVPRLHVGGLSAEEVKATLSDWIGRYDIGSGNLMYARLLRINREGNSIHYADMSYNGRVKTLPENSDKVQDYMIRVDEGWVAVKKPKPKLGYEVFATVSVQGIRAGSSEGAKTYLEKVLEEELRAYMAKRNLSLDISIEAVSPEDDDV